MRLSAFIGELMAIIKKPITLPSKLEDLTRFVLIGREKLNSVRSEIRAINKLGLAKEVREQKRDEAQMLAGALLDAESKIGEITLKMPKDNPNKRIIGGNKSSEIKELGFTNVQVSQFQQLSENKDVIEQVKAEAIENDDLPTRTEVLRKIKEKERKIRDEIFSKKEIKMPDGLFNVILSDPPWAYDFSKDNSDKIENHYPTMELEEIKSLKIPAAENSVLFLWATAPKLNEAISLMTAWGFDYKTCAIWDKQWIGLGYWFRGQHELLLIGTKGIFSPPEKTNLVSSVYSEKRTKHSKKPDYYYELIEKYFPNGKYLELFARKKFNNRWHVYGNEI